MSKIEEPKIIREEGGVFNDFLTRIRLIFRLMADSRVSFLLKLIPIASLIYLIVPAPIPPDLIPLPLDDVMVIWLGMYLFIELCPPEVVEEHMKALDSVVPGKWRDPEGDENVIDTDWKEI